MLLLEPQVLLWLLILYPLGIILSLLLVFLHIRRPIGFVSMYVQFFLIVALIGTCALIMKMSALDSAVHLMYSALVNLSVYTLGAILAIFAIHLVSAHRKKGKALFLSPDFNGVFQAIDDLVIMVDLTGCVIACNHPALYTALFGQACTHIDTALEQIGISISIATPHSQFTTKADSEEKYCDFQSKAFRISQSPILIQSKVVASAFVFQDVTELRAAERALEAHNCDLEQTNKKLENAVALGHHLEVEEERLQLIEALQMDLIGRIEKTNLALNRLLDQLPETADQRSHLIAKQTNELRDIYSLLRKTLLNYTGKVNR